MRVALAAALAAVLAIMAEPARAAESEAVQRLVDEGRDLFRAARYDDALARYEVAFERSGANGLVYMIGRASENLVASAVRSIEDVGAQVIGIVTNDARGIGLSYGYNYSERYYRYEEDKAET